MLPPLSLSSPPALKTNTGLGRAGRLVVRAQKPQEKVRVGSDDKRSGDSGARALGACDRFPHLTLSCSRTTRPPLPPCPLSPPTHPQAQEVHAEVVDVADSRRTFLRG